MGELPVRPSHVKPAGYQNKVVFWAQQKGRAYDNKFE